jgi:serine/threonine-protein kinase
VARCIAAGLTVTEIEAARKKFLASHAGAETNAHVKFVTGKAWEGKAAYSQAVDLYEQALQLDPLNLAVQQRYWALKRRPQP